jgi:hypothetical protein
MYKKQFIINASYGTIYVKVMDVVITLEKSVHRTIFSAPQLEVFDTLNKRNKICSNIFMDILLNIVNA